MTSWKTRSDSDVVGLRRSDWLGFSSDLVITSIGDLRIDQKE